ncbi:MAG: hypothetical protein HOM58_09155 [Rhodospirillaceae bacterium]|nr:hypothetical protein [Rhodospirillaceae bacterium]MBT5455020.1 hypothetical protein [Rhodospirillaceae bacterium]
MTPDYSSLLTAIGTVFLLLAACTGIGAAILRLLGIARDLDIVNRVAWSFSLGLGLLGWLIFFPAAAGKLSFFVLLGICLVGVGSLVFFDRSSFTRQATTKLDGVSLLIIAALILVMLVDIFEGLSPPADADTLAYHFTLPKRHLSAGELVFVPRAIDGAPPQLIHMTYVAALGIGGERALTLWTMLSGWMTGLLLFGLCRRYLAVNWSLAIVLLYLSTPAILQTGGAGHIEPRIAQFVLLGAVAAGIAVHQNGINYCILSGLCAGFFVGAKYTGLLFAVACVMGLLVARNRFKLFPIFCLTVLLAGFQWYFWVWIKTGDPLFPMLFNVLGVSDPALWSEAQNAMFEEWRSVGERHFPITPWWFFFYPLYATFVDSTLIESGRTGLGLIAFLALPFAAFWLLSGWRRDLRNPLCVAGLIVVAFYALWFFSGSPQRVRHLLPLFPLILLGLFVAAVRGAESAAAIKPLVAACILCIGFQSAGQAFYGWNYMRYVFSDESREQFLKRNVSAFGLVPWINRNLSQTEKVLTTERQLLYYFDVPVRMSHSRLQQGVNLVRLRDNPGRLYQELRDARITHILASSLETGAQPRLAETIEVIRPLIRAGCFRETKRSPSRRFKSRTLKTGGLAREIAILYALTPTSCRL